MWTHAVTSHATIGRDGTNFGTRTRWGQSTIEVPKIVKRYLRIWFGPLFGDVTREGARPDSPEFSPWGNMQDVLINKSYAVLSHVHVRCSRQLHADCSIVARKFEGNIQSSVRFFIRVYGWSIHIPSVLVPLVACAEWMKPVREGDRIFVTGLYLQNFPFLWYIHNRQWLLDDVRATRLLGLNSHSRGLSLQWRFGTQLPPLLAVARGGPRPFPAPRGAFELPSSFLGDVFSQYGRACEHLHTVLDGSQSIWVPISTLGMPRGRQTIIATQIDLNSFFQFLVRNQSLGHLVVLHSAFGPLYLMKYNIFSQHVQQFSVLSREGYELGP